MIKSDVSSLGKWSNQIIDLVCDNCGVEKSIKYKLYTSYGYENGSYYCRKCKLKQNNLEKWGVENPFQLKEVKEKIKRTNLEKWGVENPSQNYEINKKIKESISKLDKEEINKKREITNLEKWGVRNVSQAKKVKEKKAETNIENWGTDNNKKSDIFRKRNFKITKHVNYISYEKEGVSLFKCDNNKDHEFKIEIDNFIKRIKYNSTLCTECFPIGTNQSGKEIKLYNFIKSHYSGEIIQCYRDIYEIDIYLPQLKLGFEFNGVHWHSDLYREKNSHLEKTKHFSERGIRIIHIWEDHWDLKSEIIKSQILNWLGLSKKIFARKCNIKEVEVDESSSFLEKNHIQGKIGSNLKLGLYLGEELVSLMTFDHLEGRKRIGKENWNINRFCNKRGYTVVGGASKIFKYFISNFEVNRVISYADRDWSLGVLYKTLGFNKISESLPDYKYVINGIRVHKSHFKKSKIGISEGKLNTPKIWDCGKIKWEFINTKKRKPEN